MNKASVPLRYAIPDVVFACISLRGRVRRLEREAGKAREARDYEAAQLLYARILLITRMSHKPSIVARAQAAIGNLYWEAGDFKAALTAYRESLAIERKLGNEKRIPHVNRGIGSILSQQGEWAEGERLLHESLEQFKRLNAPVDVAFCLEQLAFSACQRHSFPIGLSLALQAADLFAKNEELGVRAECLYIAAFALLQMDRFEEAESVTAEMLTLYRLELPRGLARGLTLRGWQRFGIGDEDSGELHLKEALDLATYGREYECTLLIANVYWMFGHVETSIDILEEMLRHVEDNNLERRAVVLNSIGYHQIPDGRLEEALNNLTESLKISRESGGKKSESYALNNLGDVHVKRGEYSEAKGFYCDSLKMKAESGDEWGAAYSFEGMAQCILQGGDAGGAARLLGMAAAIRTRLYAPLEVPLRANLALITSTVYQTLGENDYNLEFSAGHDLEWKDLALSFEPSNL